VGATARKGRQRTLSNERIISQKIGNSELAKEQESAKDEGAAYRTTVQHSRKQPSQRRIQAENANKINEND